MRTTRQTQSLKRRHPTDAARHELCEKSRFFQSTVHVDVKGCAVDVLRVMRWMLRAVMWMLRAVMWMLRAVMWMLRAVMWMLRAVMWMLRAVMWMLIKGYGVDGTHLLLRHGRQAGAFVARRKQKLREGRLHLLHPPADVK
eukprot:1179643-Prorocentrum_minimum.AAC.2